MFFSFVKYKNVYKILLLSGYDYQFKFIFNRTFKAHYDMLKM